MTEIRAQVEAFASGVPDGAAVLDVGCGLRPYEALFARSAYVGIDVEESGRTRETKLPDRYFDGVNIPYDDGQFDAVMCTQVLEHAVEPVRLLLEMHRVLSDTGRLFVTVPFMWGEHEPPYDFRRFSTFGVRQLLQGAGFQVVTEQRLVRGVDAIAMLVSSEIVNYESHQSRPDGLLRRLARVLSGYVWAVQLRLWRRLYEFERIYIDNAVVAVKG